MHNHTCPDGSYFCYPLSNNFTVGAALLIKDQDPTQRDKWCHKKSSDMDCWFANIPWKLTPEYPGYWSSTQEEATPLLQSWPRARTW